jgi:hypothetical protein
MSSCERKRFAFSSPRSSKVMLPHPPFLFPLSSSRSSGLLFSPPGVWTQVCRFERKVSFPVHFYSEPAPLCVECTNGAVLPVWILPRYQPRSRGCVHWPLEFVHVWSI